VKRLGFILLLAGCGSQTPSGAGGDAQSAADNALLANLAAEAEAKAEDPARLKARVEAAMAAILRNPKKAHYSGIRSGTGGAACGQIELAQARGKAGGFLPFVVTPEGAAIVSPSARISFDDPADPFPDAYIKYCATPDELKTLAPRLTALGSAAATGVQADIPDLPGADLEAANGQTAPAAPPDRAPSAGSAAGSPPNENDSFFNAVARKR
jgi:hypothetical protein